MGVNYKFFFRSSESPNVPLVQIVMYFAVKEIADKTLIDSQKTFHRLLFGVQGVVGSNPGKVYYIVFGQEYLTALAL